MSKDRQQERVRAINRTVTSKVRDFLWENDLTQEEMGNWLGVNKYTMNRILHPDYDSMTVDRLVAIADYMGWDLTVKLVRTRKIRGENL